MKHLVFIYSYQFKKIERPEGFENLPQQFKEAIIKAENNTQRFINILNLPIEHLIDEKTFIKNTEQEIEKDVEIINRKLNLNEYTAHLKMDKIFTDLFAKVSEQMKIEKPILKQVLIIKTEIL